jgi:hypothetical protein
MLNPLFVYLIFCLIVPMFVIWNDVRKMSLGLRSVTRRADISRKLRDIVGSFLQSKKVNDVESLWSYHCAGEDFLLNEHGIEPAQITTDFENLINKGLQAQGQYIRTIPFFWLRAPYRFYIYRFRMRGVSVKDQFSR